MAASQNASAAVANKPECNALVAACSSCTVLLQQREL
jgi:hypothetical protein